MNLFEMILVLVALGILAGVLPLYLDYAFGRNRTKTKDQRDEMQARIDRLEERVRNLERIVTSEEWTLRRRFDDLES